MRFLILLVLCSVAHADPGSDFDQRFALFPADGKWVRATHNQLREFYINQFTSRVLKKHAERRKYELNQLVEEALLRARVREHSDCEVMKKDKWYCE